MPHPEADSSRTYSGDEPLLRAELFNAEQMARHGEFLAGQHALSARRITERLLTRLSENENTLIEVSDLLTEAVKADLQITPASEWLLDNFYLIEEHIHIARRHFPKSYSRGLPGLSGGASAGLPRVYDIALEIISHGDGRVDAEGLSRFVAAYQTVTSLKLGELWAIPIMLRLALIENLRRVAVRIAISRKHRDLAIQWASQMIAIAEQDPKSLVLVIADMAESDPPMAGSFVAEFARRLQGQSPALRLPLTWIEQNLSESSQNIEQLVQAENQQQAADQVSISNSIASLRFLEAMDWREFVETMSSVENVLRRDIGGIYGQMDFSTRDRYRRVLERLAKASELSETEVATKVIELARDRAATHGDNDRGAHVGFYLIDKGLRSLEQMIGARSSAGEILRSLFRRSPLLLYAGGIILLSAIAAAGLALMAHAAGVHGWLLLPVAILAFLSSSYLTVTLVNWLATLLALPHLLPRMDFSHGIPSEFRSLVVIPTLLSSNGDIEDLAEALEVRFLGNREDNLHFALLTDFQDATEEILAEDEPLLQLARRRIEELNDKYPGPAGDRFFLLHRPRRWNPREKAWMGYERKRGKIAELNALLRGGAYDSFSLIVGDIGVLQNVKYVITLDTDTQLPRDSARQCIGVMAHPLNRARYDATRQRICEGYGVIQPRVGISLPSINHTQYARLFAGEPGIDPYTRAVSDVYQDLFAEGSFIGKGIYDVDAFQQALHARLPENLILSHDLLEGSYARTGLLSDVLLYEDYPADYATDVRRRHRWIRGDWQIACWLLPRVPGPGEHFQKNPISALSRSKILDNLRRSLVPAALTLFLLVGWTLLPSAWLWTACVIGILFIPVLLPALWDLLRKPESALLVPHVQATLLATGRELLQVLFVLACLPFEACFSLDAAIRAMLRMLVTHTRLLEWNPASAVQRNVRDDIGYYYRLMWIAPVIAIAMLAWLTAMRPDAVLVAWPILVLWCIAPALAWRISQPISRSKPKLTVDQGIFLHKLSRRIWSFFETFVGPQDHWLPPDSYQEYPSAMVAHRTSPTNMGLALLANLAAYDFGYIPAGQLIERCTHAFDSMQSLERHQGHFYNWYDTQSLQPLPPLYISTVDSGNLAGHLLTLRQGLLALPDHPIVGPQFFDGLNDSLNVLIDIPKAKSLAGLNQFRDELQFARKTPPLNLADARSCLERLMAAAEATVAGSDADDQLKWWTQALARQCREVCVDLELLLPAAAHTFAGPGGAPSLNDLARLGNAAAIGRIEVIHALAAQANQLADMNFHFLYDDARHLLAIGYNLTERRRDSSYYDLLASEARLCSFVMIAQGKLPQEHWFALGRLLTVSNGKPILVSWSGSMFEYLMPLLVMPTYEDTLLDQACKVAVQTQIAYGALRKVPWGISESGYNTLSAHFNYQYRAFGVPGLGLKRGLTEDLVIAPYAAILALMVAPEQACLNLQHMVADGFAGSYGLYEAVDYTSARLPRGQTHVIVRSFMAHHQGMSFLSLADLLLDHCMQKRFESEPSFQATTLLLQERIPKATAFYSHTAERADLRVATGGSEVPMRIFTTPNTPIPEVQLLSNGRYHVAISNAGSGYSKWKDIAITRWREDGTRDNWGAYCYLRDTDSGAVWSVTHQPTLKKAERYEAVLAEGRAEFRCSHEDIDTHTTIAVSPEDDIELRRVNIVNRSRTRRTLEITSYSEIVLAPAGADDAHPAFSNLFVETEILRERQAIVCSRRPRSADEHPSWMFHLVVANIPALEPVSYETDRLRFVGRGHNLTGPLALQGATPLSDTQGSVLDPVAAIRYRVVLEPDEYVTLNFVTGIAETRDQCLGLVEKYQDWHLARRVFDLAYTHAQVILRQLNVSEADAQIYAHLAGSVIYANPSLRAHPSVMLKNHRGQSGLWGYAISGDLPIVLLRIGDSANIDLVRQLVQAHAYWRLKGLAVDLVIWNEDHAGYRQQLHDQIMGLISTGSEAGIIDRSGGIFVKIAEQISEEDRMLLQTVARVIIRDSAGSLATQIRRHSRTEAKIPQIENTRRPRPLPSAEPESLPQDLRFFNGLGGFTPDGREYVIKIPSGQSTPAPWVNVIANPSFGTLVSESGVANTWSENSHEFRLSPWSNDTVSDPAGEAFYIRDEDSGRFWSPSPLPSRGTGTYLTRHGFGYSVFEHTEDGIQSELWMYVAMDAPVKFAVCKLRNNSGRPRKLSVTGYVEWVLADLRPKSMMHIITELGSNNAALLARNPYSAEFFQQVAFFDVDDVARSISGDRSEFLGRNGSLARPAALRHTRLSGKVGAGLDPCGAIQVPFDLADGQEREIVFRLGAGRNAEEASALAQRFRGAKVARTALAEVRQYWQHTLGAVQVETPDASLNILANGWLVYQVLSCRLWGRTAFYQPSGAFGFRDQLQDVMALIHIQPSLTRAQVVLSASRQFPEGDVQHWWQTPTGRGIRSRCSDDYLWLPLVTSRYVLDTGDTGVLDEVIHFIQGRALNPGEDSYYDLPSQSATTASLYEHCTRAIVWGLRFGEHGLPLMGTGDWNDGMNKVGEKGQGESVWLGFFLHEVLTRFKKIAELRGDTAFAERCQKEADKLRENLETHAWDGAWYRRAWYDDGTLLGSSSNSECQIDSIAQSWAVLSGVAPAARAHKAMQAVDDRLVDRKDALVKLLVPPFDTSEKDPGYIKGYPPGVRENGGQYTHAAAWAAMAFAALGNRQQAWELLNMLNPLHHGGSVESIALYKVEPYVMASDVYALPPHTGHGGWTWYTGSAGWMYQLIVESLLGLRLSVNKLYVEPCLPADWTSIKIHYRYRETTYHISILQTQTPEAGIQIISDGELQPDNGIPLIDDHQEHSVEVRLAHAHN
ncbi:MAG: glucoamylase family protein [Gammaproteobacteria bacterium]